MKLLLDTNIIIPLEPTTQEGIVTLTVLASELSRLAAQTGTQLWVHPAQRIDVEQDRNEQRRLALLTLLNKYPTLEIAIGSPPTPPIRTNDWVDDHLVRCVAKHAVTALVTEDKDLTRRAVRELGPERVLSLADAIASLQALLEAPITPLLSAVSVRLYNLDINSDFWNSFRNSYESFDDWFARCQEEHRPAWMIPDEAGNIAGIVIVNHEVREPRVGKTLKICSLKVVTSYSGRRYGEVLLRAVFMHAYQNQYESVFVTVFEEHQALISLLLACGFIEEGVNTGRGEKVYTKTMAKEDSSTPTEDPFEFFVQQGPFVIDPNVRAFIIPIWPHYHDMLFPELSVQAPLFMKGEARGNSLRKAYLSSSPLKTVPRGSLVYFYRSRDEQSVLTWGVVERTLRSADASKICDFVFPRTVYTREEIQDMTSKGEVLCMMFRQCLRPIPRISLESMLTSKAIKGVPQSITELKGYGRSWMTEQCQVKY